MLRRVLSTNVTDPKDVIRELKRHVHRLYKHIHPDRLGRFPQHRRVNEASFQVLQSALERHFDRVEARTKNIPPQAYQAPKELTFFAQEKQKSSEIMTRVKADDNGLRKAVIPFHESNLGHALHTLFESLGLEPPPHSILPGQKRAPFGQEGQEFVSLTDLVRHARRVIMTNVKKQHAGASASAQPGIDDEMLVTRLALQRSRGVHITLGAGLPGKEKLVLIFRRLARTLAGARRADLSHLVVEIDGGFDVCLNTEGAHPWIVLGACASAETWLDSLTSEEVSAACARSKQRMARLQEMEARTAIMLGVKLVMHNITVLEINGNSEDGEPASENKHAKMEAMLRASSLLDEYEVLLQSLIELSNESNASQGMASVALMIEDGQGISTEAEQGVIRVGLSGGAIGVLAALRSHGASVSRTVEHVWAEREVEEKRVANVKRAVGINSLRRGEGVSNKQWSEALTRMRADAGRLRGVLDGVPVVVGTQARILAESGEVEVPFDFYESIRV